MKSISPANDTAIGAIAGFFFQFEKALLELAKLTHPKHFITIEQVDDIATHTPEGAVLLAIQAKHSISASRASFTDTSHNLWRTIQIWIQKLKKGSLTVGTKFTCCANSALSDDSLLLQYNPPKFPLVI